MYCQFTVYIRGRIFADKKFRLSKISQCIVWKLSEFSDWPTFKCTNWITAKSTLSMRFVELVRLSNHIFCLIKTVLDVKTGDVQQHDTKPIRIDKKNQSSFRVSYRNTICAKVETVPSVLIETESKVFLLNVLMQCCKHYWEHHPLVSD